MSPKECMRLLILVLTMLLIGCSFPFSTISRPDTRKFMSVQFQDSLILQKTISIATSRLPNENAVCLYGFYKDTTITRTQMDTIVQKQYRVAVVDNITQANVETSSKKYITFINNTACDDNTKLIGIAHIHPIYGIRCDHSAMDAIFLFSQETKYWFSLVFCPYGSALLWADGRRYVYRLQLTNERE